MPLSAATLLGHPPGSTRDHWTYRQSNLDLRACALRQLSLRPDIASCASWEPILNKLSPLNIGQRHYRR